jgi:hypothetical protein
MPEKGNDTLVPAQVKLSYKQYDKIVTPLP